MSRKKAAVKPGNILFNILLIVTVICVGFVAFNLATGAKGYAVTSDSMAKTLERGDLVYSRPVSFDDLKVGDIVTVGDSSLSAFFTHRIVEINRDERTVTTKGDNNPSTDPIDSPEKRIVGKMWYSVPLLGYFSIAFGAVYKTKGLIILALIAMALVALNIALTRAKKKNGGGSNE